MEFAAYIRKQAGMDATTLPDADIVILTNPHIDEIAAKIASKNEDYFGILSTANLVETTGVSQREYPFPDDLLSRMKRIEAMLDGVNWVRLLPFDLNKYKKTTDEATIIQQFSNEQGGAYYDLFRRSIWIYSGHFGNVTGGLKLWSIAYPAHLSGTLNGSIDMSVDPTTTTHGFPRQFHKILADKVVVDIKTGKDRPIPLTQSEQKIDEREEAALEALPPMDFDRILIGELPPASEEGDNGFEY